MQVRTINGAISELKRLDPHTAITASLLRRSCKDGSLPFFIDGNRMLVSMQDVYTLFRFKATQIKKK